MRSIPNRPEGRRPSVSNRFSFFTIPNITYLLEPEAIHYRRIDDRGQHSILITPHSRIGYTHSLGQRQSRHLTLDRDNSGIPGHYEATKAKVAIPYPDSARHAEPDFAMSAQHLPYRQEGFHPNPNINISSTSTGSFHPGSGYSGSVDVNVNLNGQYADPRGIQVSYFPYLYTRLLVYVGTAWPT